MERQHNTRTSDSPERLKNLPILEIIKHDDHDE